jgi:hypothetical protein
MIKWLRQTFCRHNWKPPENHFIRLFYWKFICTKCGKYTQKVVPLPKDAGKTIQFKSYAYINNSEES